MHPVHKFVRRRPNLSISIVVGVFAGLLLPSVWNPITRALYAWNIAVWLYLVLMAFLLMGVSHARVREMAEQEDESAVAILAILSVAAIASLAAIAIELSALKDLPFTFRVAKYAFTGSTIIGSWFLIAVLYTVHYAHLFYRSPPGHRALQFPDKEQTPDYWDFMYFSFTIAVAAQTSDIVIMSHSLRKTVLAQSILSFFFNVAILGLSINIAASLVNS